MKVRRALLSVANKEGIEDFAHGLHSLGIEIIASAGTRAVLAAEGIPVVPTSDITDFSDKFLGGRVKTLQARIHAGILADRRNPDHMNELQEFNIKTIDLVCVNLYRLANFDEDDISTREAINQIDIGGPMMLRTAALNYRYVGVVVRPVDYREVIRALSENENEIPERLRGQLASRAFTHVAQYETDVSVWFRDRFEGDRDANAD